eukprot:977146-Pelagomonas_calceolata.AAC.2
MANTPNFWSLQTCFCMFLAVENLKLIYSPRTNLSHSVDGVTVRPTHGFEKTLNPLAPLISELESQGGWQGSEDLGGSGASNYKPTSTIGGETLDAFSLMIASRLHYAGQKVL